MGGPGSGRKRSELCPKGHDKKGQVQCPECAKGHRRDWEKSRIRVAIFLTPEEAEALDSARGEVPRATYVRDLVHQQRLRDA